MKKLNRKSISVATVVAATIFALLLGAAATPPPKDTPQQPSVIIESKTIPGSHSESDGSGDSENISAPVLPTMPTIPFGDIAFLQFLQAIGVTENRSATPPIIDPPE